MKHGFFKSIRDMNEIKLRITMLICIVVNVSLALIVHILKLPMYFDTAGTMLMSMLGGLFPGMLTGVATNVICCLFNEDSLYYTCISVWVAIASVRFVNHGGHRKIGKTLLFILYISLVSGILGTMIQWFLYGGPEFADVAEAAKIIGKTPTAYFLACVLINSGYNLLDKGLAILVSLLVLRMLPDGLKKSLRNSAWKQKPISIEEMKDSSRSREGHSLKGKLTVMNVLTATVLTVAMAWISITVNYANTKKEYTENAKNAAKLASMVIDADMTDEYLQHGYDAEGYGSTRELLYEIRENSRGVKYLYVMKITKDACYAVFDLDTDDTPAYDVGERIEFEDAFRPYLTDLFAGREIEPIESNDISGWVVTAYYPVRNEAGKTTCYVGADVSMKYLSDYVRDYLLKSLLIFSGFFSLVLVYGLWISRYNLVYPIGSITKETKDFAVNSEDQKGLDESVKNIRALDIRTADEVEELYKAICKMSSDMAEQVRSIRYYADASAKMQNGLIITMADMVENRDSDTGAHIQKTAAYVRIILEGLKEKGYYSSKITPNYISDVEMSAPLHDVGKINISDAILNKPGKLTDEEYEIMKTHTTAGKKIIEKAISTLQGENYLKEARNMAAYHHERWDGNGYPEKLRGEVIPLSARVMAVADVFDALASPRVYKPAFPFEKAVAIIEEGSGTQFDPKCVEVFMDSLDEVRAVLRKFHGDEW